MKSELLAQSPLLALPLVALFLFLVVFVTVVAHALRRRRVEVEETARLPLEDDHG
jgi:cbb3-type cytochrome oxidase subunit 3